MSETKSKSVTGKAAAKVDLSATLAFVEGDVRRLEEALGLLEKRAIAAEELASSRATELSELRLALDSRDAAMRADLEKRDAELREMFDKMSVSAPRAKPGEGKARTKNNKESSSRPKKAKKEKSYENYGWTGRDLCTLLDCALKGADPIAVAAFMSSQALPKDLAAFAKQDWDGGVPKPARTAMEALRKSIELNFDAPEKGVKGFSSTVIRKSNAFFRLADEATPDTDVNTFRELARLMKAACAAQKDVLTNGPPLASPEETPTVLDEPTSTPKLSLKKPVLEKQVRVLPARLRDMSPRPTNNGPKSVCVFGEEAEEEAEELKDEIEEDTRSHTETVGEPSEIGSSRDDKEEDEDEEEEEEPEEEEPEEEGYEPSLKTMHLTFEELVAEWETVWQECRNYPKLFGTITNTRGMVTIFVRIDGNEEKDKKRIVAKVAHDTIAFSKLGKEVPLNEIV
jgi:hypothetical protein